MNVDLVTYTPNAEALCAAAMRLCQVSDKDSFMDIYKLMVEGTSMFNVNTKIKEFISLAIELGHESILEHASFTFSAEGISRVLTHQLVRHRIASYSQQSQRHVNIVEPSVVIPESFKNKIIDSVCVEGRFKELMEALWEFYRKASDVGIPIEDVRFILPNACTTKIVVTMNARELRHFFKLRCSKHAQWEIRKLANSMLELCYNKTPILFEDLYEKFIRVEVNNENK